MNTAQRISRLLAATLLTATLAACGGGGSQSPVGTAGGNNGSGGGTPNAGPGDNGGSNVPVTSSAITDEQVTLSNSGGSAVIQRNPVSMSFMTANGEPALSSTPQSALALQARPINPQRGAAGTDGPDQPPLYAPFTFIVGTSTQQQYPASFLSAIWRPPIPAALNTGWKT